MKNSVELLIALLRCYLRSETPTFDIGEEELKEARALARKHDVEHMVGIALSSLQLNSSETFFASQMKALMRSEQQNFERSRVCELFEREGIDYLPLKGSVIRDIYPEAWHRTSCDIDILVRENDLDRAVLAVKTEFGYEVIGKSEHDVSIMANQTVHFELHYDFHEQDVSTDEIWARSSSVNGTHRYEMPPEIFVYCHIAHMAKHFKNGGCGLRGFIDLYMIEHRVVYDKDALRSLLAEKGLESFSRAVFSLLDLWFGEGEETPLTLNMSQYILNAGAYGSTKNKVAVQRAQKSRVRYFWSRIFLSREALKYKYPVLEKHPIMLPVCQVRRWFSLVFGGKLGQAKKEFDLNKNMEESYKDSVNDMIKELGI